MTVIIFDLEFSYLNFYTLKDSISIALFLLKLNIIFVS